MKASNSSSAAPRSGEIAHPNAHGWRGVAARRGVRPAFEFRLAAFSLIEILVVVALLSIIVLGLLAMFSQTQRAFRAGLTQTDVLASGRLTSDQFARELEQITPAYQTGMNFYAQIPFNATTYKTPFLQPLPGAGVTNITQFRTNLIQDLFFVSKVNQDWLATGYFVRVNNPANGNLSLSPLGVGDLYRFATNATPLSGRTVGDMFNEFLLARNNEDLVIGGRKVNHAAKLAEGVVHFKVRAFDPFGTWIVTNVPPNITAEYVNYSQQLAGDIERYTFTNNAVPGTVEVELGILEDKTWQRFKAQPAIAQYKYLTNQVGRVHLFRQRVAVRNLDPLAYP